MPKHVPTRVHGTLTLLKRRQNDVNVTIFQTRTITEDDEYPHIALLSQGSDSLTNISMQMMEAMVPGTKTTCSY